MTSSGLASPPRAARSPVRPPTSSPPRPTRPTPALARARPSYERVLAWSLAVSLLAHILFLTFSSFGIRVAPPGGGAPHAAPAASARPFGMQMVVAVPSENAPDLPPLPVRTQPVQPPRPESQTPTEPVQAEQSGGAGTAGAGADQGSPQGTPGAPTGSSASDAFRPGYDDPRLYTPDAPFPQAPRQTQHEKYMEHLDARLDAVNDSLGVAAERDRRTSDWTITDDSGGKWGIDGDGLHLGGFTVPRALLPLPRATGDNASLEADRERQRMREEIQAQEADRERDETSEDRIEAIRERQDRERRAPQEENSQEGQ